MLDDYILYLIEYVQVEEQIREFLTSVPSDAPPRFVEAFFSGIFHYILIPNTKHLRS